MLIGEQRIGGIGSLGRGAGAVDEAGALGEVGVTSRRIELSPLLRSGGCGLLMPWVDM